MNKTLKTLAIGALFLTPFAFSNCGLLKNKNSDKSNSMSDTLTTSTGLKVLMTEKLNGEKPVAGDLVTVHYDGKLMDDSTFDSSYKRGKPFSFVLGTGQVIPGWEEGIAMLGKGDKATLVIPPALAYGAQGAGGVIPPNATIKFHVELVDVKKPKTIEAYNVKGKDTLTLKSGLKYMFAEKGTGQKTVAGKTIKVHYTGYLEDGTIFDSSVKRDEPFEFTFGVGQVIVGWEEGLGQMRVGDKVRLIIPSHLGYGDQGAGDVIPPNATLVFDVELLEVKM